jgi:DNA polymerase-3 subunit alpha
MAFVQIGDLFGSAEMVCFSNLYTEVVEFLEGEQALLAMLRVDRSRDELSLIAEALAPLDTVLAQQVRRICISTHALAWDKAAIERFAELARSNPGDVAVHFHLHLANGATAELSSGLTLCWNEEVKNRLRDWFDENAVQLLCKSWQPVVAVRQGGRKQERKQYAA